MPDISDQYGRKGPTFYYNWMESLLQMPDELFIEILRTYFNYCLTGELKESDNFMVDRYIKDVLCNQTERQGENYAKRSKRYSLEDFIPYFMNHSYSNVEISSIIGCSEGTVRNKRKVWDAMTNVEQARFYRFLANS